jgi:uncharacterized phage protein (TIGR01671 family)
MRDIEFRVWAVGSQVMFKPDTEDGWELNNGTLKALPNTIIEQYTGLKDKNGVKIYEGDILHCDGIICAVVYSEQYASFALLYNGFTFPLYHGDLSKKERKLLGNIHENQELLESKS